MSSKPIISQQCNTQTCWGPIDDSFSVEQDSSLTIPFSSLIKNDILLSGQSIKSYSYSGVYGGTVQQKTDSFVFTPSVKTGSSAGFKYGYTLTDGSVSHQGNININIERLRNIKAYIFDTEDQFNSWKNTYTPPSLSDVFKSWNRFSNYTAYYPSGTTPGGEAASWEMSGSDRFRCTVNSSYPTGFISPNKYDNYILESTFSSTANDDDMIGLVIAFNRLTDTNQYLTVCRAPGGVNPPDGGMFYIRYFYGSTNKYLKSTSTLVNNAKGNWSNVGSTRVRVERTKTGIICSATPFGSVDLNNSTSLILNFDDYSELSFCESPCNYGFVCWSQQYSSFTDVDFRGGDVDGSTAYVVNPNSVYKYVNDSWVKQSSTIQQGLGWPRTVTGVTTNKVYEIEQSTITTK